MDMYGHDFSAVDDLLDFSNDDVLLCSSITNNNINNINNNINNINITSSNTTTSNHHFQYGLNNNINSNINNNNNNSFNADFNDCLSLPSHDVAELEWLSNFVHDSFSNFPANNMIGTINYRPQNNNNNNNNNDDDDDNNASFHSRSRTKRSIRTVPTTNTSWTTSSPSISTSSSTDAKPDGEVVRRCTHCASEKTPQWRTGPLGPKTLCNACGVRYKSGRLVPEYRPAASPTFVLTQHSNSHRKVMELRRQKEVVVGQQQQQLTDSEYQMYGGEHHRYNRSCNKYEVC